MIELNVEHCSKLANNRGPVSSMLVPVCFIYMLLGRFTTRTLGLASSTKQCGIRQHEATRYRGLTMELSDTVQFALLNVVTTNCTLCTSSLRLYIPSSSDESEYER